MRAMWVLAALLWYVPGAGVSKTAGIPMIYLKKASGVLPTVVSAKWKPLALLLPVLFLFVPLVASIGTLLGGGSVGTGVMALVLLV